MKKSKSRKPIQAVEKWKFRSMRQTLELLDCSKPCLYSKIKKGLIKPHYLEYNDQGIGVGKPYFNIGNIQASLN